ncbi:MAG: DUF6178 family protein [Desulfobacteraceae bacterium]|jgi:hypothetical protein
MTFITSKLKTPQNLLNHILEQPQLPAIIQRLDASMLTKLIHHIGLEDSAEIVSMTTANQLKSVFDEDLWHSEAPGKNEIFNAERFGLWLEILLESGPAFAAEKLTEMDEDLIILGLCRLVRVVNFNNLSHDINSDQSWNRNDMLDEILDCTLSQEFDAYLVVARSQSRWEAIRTVLTELNELDHTRLKRLLMSCCKISWESMENNSEYYHVFTAEETLEADLAAERDGRRGRKGFVSSTDGAYFLASARRITLKKIVAEKGLEPDARVYLKRVSTETEPDANGESTAEKLLETSSPHVIHFIETLQAAEILPSARQAKLGWQAEEEPHHLPLAGAMRLVGQMDPELYSQRLIELTYLSNILISGCSFKGRSFWPGEAAEAALSVCNLGSEYLIKAGYGQKEKQKPDLLTILLKKYHLVKLFKVGWKILNDKVTVYTARTLLVYLQYLKDEQTALRQKIAMAHMAHRLKTFISSGHPWKFSDHMDSLLTILDGQTIMVLTDLLQEYPTISEVICKQHCPSSHIWRMAHIRSIQRFMDKVLKVNGRN